MKPVGEREEDHLGDGGHHSLLHRNHVALCSQLLHRKVDRFLGRLFSTLTLELWSLILFFVQTSNWPNMNTYRQAIFVFLIFEYREELAFLNPNLDCGRMMGTGWWLGCWATSTASPTPSSTSPSSVTSGAPCWASFPAPLMRKAHRKP